MQARCAVVKGFQRHVGDNEPRGHRAGAIENLPARGGRLRQVARQPLETLNGCDAHNGQHDGGAKQHKCAGVEPVGMKQARADHEPRSHGKDLTQPRVEQAYKSDIAKLVTAHLAPRPAPVAAACEPNVNSPQCRKCERRLTVSGGKASRFRRLRRNIAGLLRKLHKMSCARFTGALLRKSPQGSPGV